MTQKQEEQLYDKMMIPIFDFVYSLQKDINPKAKKALGKEEWLIKGINVEKKVWELVLKSHK